ncbi:MAG TPA: LemA family protein [Flavobacterium sp.]|nr:LemA family protein [Flavobacterium sp.]
MSLLLILIIIAAALVLWVIVAYNGLVSSRNRVDEAWSDIDVQLKRRYDLIPNLVETVKGYASHESNVLNQVTEARAKAISVHGTPDMQQAENQLTSALRSVFAVAENYPDLKASQNFGQLQSDLTDTEDKIQASRRFYNANVRDYNTRIQTFPTNIIARMFAFLSRDLFEIESADQRENVKVSF